jgi:hypothetical protein
MLCSNRASSLTTRGLDTNDHLLRLQRRSSPHASIPAGVRRSSGEISKHVGPSPPSRFCTAYCCAARMLSTKGVRLHDGPRCVVEFTQRD